MLKLKEFYQCKRELNSPTSFLQTKVRIPLPKIPLTDLQSQLIENDSFCILYLKVMRTNTSFTLTDVKGKVQVHKTCGAMGFQGKKKRTTKFALASTLNFVLYKANALGNKKILIVLNGYGRLRFSLRKFCKDYDLKIIGIRDITPIPHNGCRPKKVRRL